MDDAFESLPDFKNRAVTCYVAGVPAENAVTLDSPVFELQAGRIFLAGQTVAAAPDDWTRGVRVCGAWDEVVQYMVFESSEEFQSRIGADPPGGFLGFLGRR